MSDVEEEKDEEALESEMKGPHFLTSRGEDSDRAYSDLNLGTLNGMHKNCTAEICKIQEDVAEKNPYQVIAKIREELGDDKSEAELAAINLSIQVVKKLEEVKAKMDYCEEHLFKESGILNEVVDAAYYHFIEGPQRLSAEMTNMKEIEQGQTLVLERTRAEKARKDEEKLIAERAQSRLMIEEAKKRKRSTASKKGVVPSRTARGPNSRSRYND